MIRDRWLFGRRTRRFTLQWHLTQRCSFSCRHCYDRSVREEPSLARAIDIVDQLLSFCAGRRVQPHISLSGGDPLLYPHFWQLYQYIARRGITVSLLGNPASAHDIERLLEMQRPVYYQVSLEGQRHHNDEMRGKGHYDQVMSFLRDSRSRGLETHVMLTLTRENLEQVIPLGMELRGLIARMTFSRLSQAGRGADLSLPSRPEFVAFLRQYLDARRSNPVFGFKENLFNVLRHASGEAPFPGCTGFGCGAAFNFVALLPDGEVHACRKFPSPIGHLRSSSLESIYDSPLSRTYREGPASCGHCRLRDQCRGCMAVTAGHGLSPLLERDPYCFAGPAEIGLSANASRILSRGGNPDGIPHEMPPPRRADSSAVAASVRSSRYFTIMGA